MELTKKTLKEAGATSEETAKTPEELKLDERWCVAWLKMSATTIERAISKIRTGIGNSLKYRKKGQTRPYSRIFLRARAEHIHDTSIMLLQECTYAIFEITVTNGHLMEIERAKDFQDLRVILVYQTLDPSSRPSITRMLMTTSFEKSAYMNFIQLTKILGNFLT